MKIDDKIVRLSFMNSFAKASLDEEGNPVARTQVKVRQVKKLNTLKRDGEKSNYQKDFINFNTSPCYKKVTII